MPDRKTHLKAGAVTGAVVAGISNLVIQKKKMDSGLNDAFDWAQFLLSVSGGAVLGGAAGLLPDLFEPATSCYHRDFFHSISCALLICYSLQQSRLIHLTEGEKAVLNISAAGYISHLTLDALTPMTLPLI
jgi:membrane-bound metal-dependent hydrolase YbcI (DUF457 family)